MATNRNFCRIIDDGKGVEYAPDLLYPNPLPPTLAEYLAAGWLRNGIEPPAPPPGKVFAGVTYRAAVDCVVADYSYLDAPPPVRTFSKLRLYAALAQAGFWDTLCAWLKTQTVDGVNAFTAFELAQELSDAHPLFKGWFAAAKTALDVDDVTADAILKAAEVAP